MTSDELNRRFVYSPRKFLVWSLLFHLGVVGFMGVYQVLDKFNLTPFPKKKDLMEQVYQEFVQVDVVDLPDILMKDLDKIDASLPVVDDPQELPKPVDVPAEDPEAMAELEAAKKAKAEEAKQKAEEAKRLAEEAKKKKEAEKQAREEALRKLEEEAKRADALAALEKEAGRKQLKGNIVSKGSATKGNIGTAKDQYRSLIAKKIKEHFNVFSWQKKKNLLAVVFIKVGPDGRLLEKKIVQSSSDRLYDSAVLEAVQEAEPLPLPRDMSLVADGITIEFRPDD